MVHRKTASALKLATLPVAALLACSLSTQSMAAWMAPVIAQASSFSVPDSVAKGTSLEVSSGSDNMNSITEALKSGFESKYSNAEVSVETKDVDAAIKDVLNGNADLAAISRPLTDAEKAQNLLAVAARREKIAIIVGKNNPFTGSLTGSQFAQIFRGEITNWSEVGGPDKSIRLIDLPETSETRQSLRPYPVFVSQPFETGSNATQASDGSITAIAKELGDDGISYALVGQLEGVPNVKAIPLHKTLPTDPRYPFSQPYSFVYAGAASPAVKAFLGYATGAPGQTAIEGTRLSGYAVAPTAGAAVESSGMSASTPDGTQAAGADGAEGSPPSSSSSTIDPTTGNSIAADGTITDADGNVVTTLEEAGTTADGEVDGVIVNADANTGELSDRGRWWWLLLPIAGLGLLIWAASKRGNEEETGYIANADRDDTIRTNYRNDAGKVSDKAYATSEVGDQANAGVGRAVAGGTALAGGAAVAGAGLASRPDGLSEDTGNVTMDLDGIGGGTSTGIDSVKGIKQEDTTQGELGHLGASVQGGGIDSTHGNVQSGMGDTRGSLQGGIDNVKGNVQGGGVDSTRGNLSSGVESVKGRTQDGTGGARGKSSDWLDRAKQRINEAADQVKDKAGDIKDDVTGKD